ncbi:MAG: hypothetical protein ACXV6M_02445 [Ilumatobacteraceae bacterium]
MAVTTSTTGSSSTTEPIASGWTDFEAMPSEAFPPCCASTWEGTPSPPLPRKADPIPDGIYHATRVAWSATDPTTMVVDVQRFEACGLLPSGSCEPPPVGEPFLAGQLGISLKPVRRLTITLDDSVRVGLIGFDTDIVKRQATGAELVPLLVELDRAYNEVLAAPLLAGGDADSIIAGLQRTPAEGFGPSPRDSFGSLVFSYDGAPPVLMQGPFDYTGSGRQPIDATSVVSLRAIQFDRGVVSLYFYAGYYP